MITYHYERLEICRAETKFSDLTGKNIKRYSIYYNFRIGINIDYQPVRFISANVREKYIGL